MIKNLLCCIAVLLAACSTPQKSFDKQNYGRAFELALAALQRNKSVKENKTILNKSLNELIKEGFTEAGQKKNSTDLRDKDRALKIYENLQDKIKDAVPFIGQEYAPQYEQLQDFALDVQNELYLIYLQNGLNQLNQAIDQKQKKLAQQAYTNL